MKIAGYMPEIRKVMLLIETSCVYGRELSDILATEDRDVRQAVRFIRQHVKEVI